MRTSGLRCVAAVVAGIGLSHCSTATSPTPNIPVTRLSDNTGSFAYTTGYTQATSLVIRNDADLASAWATIYRGNSEAPPLPAVDFTKEMVVGVAAGTEPTGGYQVVITGAREVNGGVAVNATVTKPGPSCAVTDAVTEPVDLARMPATPGSVSFFLAQTTGSC